MERDGLLRGRYQYFWMNTAKISTHVRVALSEETIASFAAHFKERIFQTALMSTNDFARLIGILTENEKSGLALCVQLQACAELSSRGE